MSEFVDLEFKRNRGWPWPEDSFGLTPMFGEDGWCHTCGTPKREQIGSLVLQRKGMSSPKGAWLPYWIYDALCLEQSLGEEISQDFSVELLPVKWHPTPSGEAMQFVAPSTESAWYTEEDLTRAALNRHPRAGARCPDCDRWRWMPVTIQDLPAPSTEVLATSTDVIASPEIFGDGMQSFRHVLFRRELAQKIAQASPRDFRIVEIGNP